LTANTSLQVEKKIVEGLVEERTEEEATKRQFCSAQEEILDMYNQQVDSLLRDIENVRLDCQMRPSLVFSVDFLCKCDDPKSHKCVIMQPMHALTI